MKTKYIDFTWHQKQFEMFNFKTRFMVGHCGRRFGKTTGSQGWMVKKLYDSDGWLAWFLAPVKEQAEKGFRSFIQLAADTESTNLGEFISHIKESKMRVELINGKVIEFKSTDRALNLKGDGLACFVMDESGTHKDYVWYEVVRPSIMDYVAPGVFLGTPKSYNWYFRLYNEALRNPALYTIFNFSSYDNPMIPHDEIKLAEEEMSVISPALVQQEIYGKFVAGELQIFKNVDKCHKDIPAEQLKPYAGGLFCIGVDLAMMQDETAIVVIDMVTYTVMHVSSFTQIAWDEQERRLYEVYKRFSCDGANSPMVYMDTTIESMVADDLERKYSMPINKIRINKNIKSDMITKIAAFIARQEVNIPKNAEGGKLVSQLNTFERIFTDTGWAKMKGKGRLPDDVVMAFALAFLPVEIDYSTTIPKGSYGNKHFYQEDGY